MVFPLAPTLRGRNTAGFHRPIFSQLSHFSRQFLNSPTGAIRKDSLLLTLLPNCITDIKNKNDPGPAKRLASVFCSNTFATNCSIKVWWQMYKRIEWIGQILFESKPLKSFFQVMKRDISGWNHAFFESHAWPDWVTNWKYRRNVFFGNWTYWTWPLRSLFGIYSRRWQVGISTYCSNWKSEIPFNNSSFEGQLIPSPDRIIQGKGSSWKDPGKTLIPIGS